MQNSPNNQTNFYVAGGPLRANHPSYVIRDADDKLFDLAKQGQFAYVLTARQMGKSSLMNRTAHRLTQASIEAVRIDLTRIGIVSAEEWYLGFLTELQRKLKLDIDVVAWWDAHARLGYLQRFITFLSEVVLVQVKRQVVIFIDEIDTTLNLDFADDFFAGIRSVFNARDEEPIFDRINFILLGVASPSDLIQDNKRTPFNIGEAVELQIGRASCRERV